MSAHGIVGNIWFHCEQGRHVYDIEDPEHHLLSVGNELQQIKQR